MVLVDPAENPGQVLETYPRMDSPLRIERFFEALYLRYDERYVYSAPDLKAVTRRREWSPDSPLFDKARAATLPMATLNYEYRIAATESETEGTPFA